MAALPEALRKRLEPFGELDQSQSRTPALTIDEFFTGNTDLGSIGCNLSPHPGLEKFEATFRSILAHDNVSDVRLPVTEFIDGLDWPFVEKVIVVTSAASQDIFSHCKTLQPDEHWVAGDKELAGFDGVSVPQGHKAVVIWWD